MVWNWVNLNKTSLETSVFFDINYFIPIIQCIAAFDMSTEYFNSIKVKDGTTHFVQNKLYAVNYIAKDQLKISNINGFLILNKILKCMIWVILYWKRYDFAGYNLVIFILNYLETVSNSKYVYELTCYAGIIFMFTLNKFFM